MDGLSSILITRHNSLEAIIKAKELWTGETGRDEHLRGSDFLDVENQDSITFRSMSSRCVGAGDFEVTGDLSIRGIVRTVILEMHYLGKWSTPFWTDKGDVGPITRIGFSGETRINRQDFEVSWNGPLENEGVVVGDDILITVDVEALLETALTKAQSGE